MSEGDSWSSRLGVVRVSRAGARVVALLRGDWWVWRGWA